MNPRKFLNFLRSRTGMLILFLLAMCAVLIVVNSHRSRTKSELSFSGKVSDVDSAIVASRNLSRASGARWCHSVHHSRTTN